MAFKIHKMYGKDGEVKTAKTKAQHLALKKKGYNQIKNKYEIMENCPFCSGNAGCC